jgi:hypothetical protein
MKLRPALALGTTLYGPGPASQDFTVSNDWSRVTEFDKPDANTDSWTSTTWCITTNNHKDSAGGFVYEKCGEKEDVQGPNPPVLKELRQ